MPPPARPRAGPPGAERPDSPLGHLPPAPGARRARPLRCPPRGGPASPERRAGAVWRACGAPRGSPRAAHPRARVPSGRGGRQPRPEPPRQLSNPRVWRQRGGDCLARVSRGLFFSLRPSGAFQVSSQETLQPAAGTARPPLVVPPNAIGAPCRRHRGRRSRGRGGAGGGASEGGGRRAHGGRRGCWQAHESFGTCSRRCKLPAASDPP